MPESLVWPYTATWIALCVVAGVLVAREPARYSFTRAAYWRLLAVPWKLATFALATGFLVFAAPYTGDPYWDGPVGLMMAVLTFVSAPWSVGTLFKVIRGKERWQSAFVAGCLWMLSASWNYDLYNRLRWGEYPLTWAANIAASSVLYACAGLCWNLLSLEGTGVTFAFTLEGWPDVPRGVRNGRLIALVAVFVVMVAAMLLPFVWNELPLARGR